MQPVPGRGLERVELDVVVSEALRAGSPGEGGVSGGQGPQATVVLGRDQSTPARPGWQGLQAPWVGKQQRLGPTGV